MLKSFKSLTTWPPANAVGGAWAELSKNGDNIYTRKIFCLTICTVTYHLNLNDSCSILLFITLLVKSCSNYNNKHGYIISSGYSSKNTMCKLSTFSSFLLLLLPSLPPSSSSYSSFSPSSSSSFTLS